MMVFGVGASTYGTTSAFCDVSRNTEVTVTAVPAGTHQRCRSRLGSSGSRSKMARGAGRRSQRVPDDALPCIHGTVAVCLATPSGQAPKPRSGAPKALGLRATACAMPECVSREARRHLNASVVDHAVCSLPQTNSVPSVQMQCRTIASFRATATLAFLAPIRFRRRMPQALSADHRLVRCRRTLAASKR
jgi:hypothetical protein